MTTIEVIGTAASGLSTVYRFLQLAIALKDAPESAKTFIELVKQVEHDLEHALRCRADISKCFEEHPEFYERWISDAINRTVEALDDLGKLMLKITGRRLETKLDWLLRNHEKLIDKERSLKYTHTTLLSAINAMHLMAFQGRSPLARPPRQPQNEPRGMERMSSKRPTSRMKPSRESSESSSISSNFEKSQTTSPMSTPMTSPPTSPWPSTSATFSTLTSKGDFTLQQLHHIRIHELEVRGEEGRGI